MKKIHWTRATGLAAALLLGSGLSPLSAQGLLNGPGGGAGGAGGQGAGGAAGTRAGLGSRLDVNSSVRGVNPAQAVRGTTNAGAGLGGGARAQTGLGIGANPPGQGIRVRGTAQGQGAARGRNGLFSDANVDAGAETDTGIEADISTGGSVDRKSLSGREHAGYQAEMTLNHRLAQIDRMRDHALATGNTAQLAKADELEAQARATFQHRLDVIRTAPDADAIPPGQPRDIRSRIRASMDSQADIGSPAGAVPPATVPSEDAESVDIAVQRPEDFGRMRQRATAGAPAESRSLLHFAPRGGATEAKGKFAARAEGPFDADANPRRQVNAASDALLEAGGRVEETTPSRVRPVANSRFAADFQGSGATQSGESIRSRGAFRGEMAADPLPGSAPRTRPEIEQVDYSASNTLDAGGRMPGRIAGAAYAEADEALGNASRAPQRARASANGAVRASHGSWEGIEETEIGGNIRETSRARVPADPAAIGAMNGAAQSSGRFEGRTDLPRRPLDDEPLTPPADPRFRGRAAADLNANGAVRDSDDVYSASSNLRGRAGTSMSNGSIRSRSQFDASAGTGRQPVDPRDYEGRP